MNASSTPLAPQALRRTCDPAQFSFATTAELPQTAPTDYQGRAVDAIRFGVGIQQPGYNLFVLGAPGVGRRTLVERLLHETPRPDAVRHDWCYVNNFADPQRPVALQLPEGRGSTLRADVQRWVEELRVAIPAALESDEYRSRLSRIDAEFNERQERAFQDMGARAMQDGIALLRTPAGFSFAPLDGHEVMAPEKFQQLPPERQRELTGRIQHYEAELEAVVRSVMQMRRERFEKVRALNQEVIEFAVGQITEDLRRRYDDLPDVANYIAAAKADVIGRADEFRKPHEGVMEIAGVAMPMRTEADLRRYRVNVVVGDGERGVVPIVYEDHPTYANLVGRAEHLQQFGALVTDFGLIRAGSLHRANGGYLLIDAIKLLTLPYAYEGLKRAIRTRQIRIESLGQVYSLISTQALEPEPIPLDVKIVLFGPRMIYFLLESADPEFSALFKVVAEFTEDVPWTEESNRALAQLVASVGRQRGLRPFGRDAVAATIERCARLAEDADKLSVHVQSVEELLAEADYFAGVAGRAVVGAADVARAVTAQLDRAGEIKQRVHEAILRDIVMIDTDGAVVGQVNGLGVFVLGRATFAQPQRITATARIGKGEVIDIHREVALAGPVHSKGVLILSAFLASRYARSRGLSLAATLTFEQTYGQVEGDSASLAELCALISVLANVPIRQSFALTGSVNQRGEVQAIGGVNDKIEGFFDICKARGLTGTQGVIIPVANTKHLMLRQDVVDAVAAGRFCVHAVAHVDAALEVLTGMPAGAELEPGVFAPGSVNATVVTRLAQWEARSMPKVAAPVMAGPAKRMRRGR